MIRWHLCNVDDSSTLFDLLCLKAFGGQTFIYHVLIDQLRCLFPLDLDFLNWIGFLWTVWTVQLKRYVLQIVELVLLRSRKNPHILARLERLDVVLNLVVADGREFVVQTLWLFLINRLNGFPVLALINDQWVYSLSGAVLCIHGLLSISSLPDKLSHINSTKILIDSDWHFLLFPMMIAFESRLQHFTTIIHFLRSFLKKLVSTESRLQAFVIELILTFLVRL